MINSTEGSFLTKSQWENDFDLVRNLNSTTAGDRYPLLGERVLPDDTDIDPTPPSQIGTRGVEMTSKSSFVKKNCAISNKQKMANITNKKQDSRQSKEEGLFKKSQGKENFFNVEYAESDASVASDIHKGRSQDKQIHDLISSQLTEPSPGVKKNMFNKKGKAIGFLDSDDSDDEFIMRRDVHHDSMHVTVTNHALHLIGKDATNVNPLETINKSIHLDEEMQDTTENLDAPTQSIAITQEGLPPLLAEDDHNDTSISTNLSLSYCYQNARKSKMNFAREKRMSFNEKPETVSSSTNAEERPTAEDPPSLLETSSPFVAPKRPFSRPSTRSKKEFHVSLEETVTSSGSERKRKTDSPVSSELPSVSKESLPFICRATKDFSFPEVDFEETGSLQEKSLDNSVSGNAVKNARESVFSLKSRKTEFHVDFDKTDSTPRREEETGSDTTQEKSTENSFSGNAMSRARKSVFARRSKKTEGFQVDFDKTESTPHGESQNESVAAEETGLENLGNATKSARKSVFTRRSKKTGDFQVDFDKTESTPLREPDSSFKTPTGNLRKRKQKEADTFNFFPDSFDNTKNSSPPKQDLFGKKTRKDDDFNVSFEESRRKNDTLDQSETTLSQENGRKNILEKKLFQRKSWAAAKFETSFDDTDRISNVSIGSKGKAPSVKSIGERSSQRSLGSLNSENTFGEASRPSPNVTVIDKTGKSALGKTNESVCTDQGEISYNDDNLNGFMSDSSEEEPRALPVLKSPTSPAESLSKSCDPPNLAVWEAKFNNIIEIAKTKNNKVPEKRPMKMQTNKIQHNRLTQKTPKRKLKKPAPYATQRLYGFLIGKLKQKCGADAVVRAEQLVEEICETVKKVIRRKDYQKKLIQDLKKEMAKLEIVETTMDFYNFIIDYLPDSFRHKVIPSVRPLTNAVYPPSEIANPFEKILV